MRAVALVLVLACSSEADRPTPAPAVRSEPAKPARSHHEVMAEKLIAAIVADDVELLRPLFGSAWADLGTLMGENIQRLRSRLSEERIDLAKAKIVRVVRTGDPQLEMVDVHLEFEGRRYRTHFSAMSTRGGYQLLGVANWIVRE